MARTGRPKSEKALYSNAFTAAMKLVNARYEFDHIHSVTWSERSGNTLNVLVELTTDNCEAGTVQVEVGFIDGEFYCLDKGMAK